MTVVEVRRGKLLPSDQALRWPDPQQGPWVVAPKWAIIGGRAECVGLEVWKGAPIKAKEFRSLPLAEILAKARALETQAVGNATRLVRPTPRRGDKAEHLADVAGVYRAALASYEHPTAAVQKHFGVSYSSATKWVAACRDQGLLGATTQGVPSPLAPSRSVGQ